MAMRRPDPSAIPPGPGVYLYRDADGTVVYVGKARRLRRRVLSYFRTEGLAPKTRALMARAESVEFLATTTEKEAFLLEASLIKKHRPRYNILLRDDKQYALFRVNLKAPYPRIEIVRRAGRDGARYFGPFTSALAARETWKLLHRAFPLRRCADRAMQNRVRPCLYHHMGQCLAPCTGKVGEEEYLRQAEAAVRVLDGKSDALLKELEAAMLEASDRLEFERAAALRDQMRAVRQTVERQAAVLPGGGDMDVVGLSPSDKGLALAVVFVRQGAVQGGRAYFWPGLAFEDASELLWSFLGQFYAEFMPPGRILLPWMPLDAEEDAEGEIEEEADDPEYADGAEAPEAPEDLEQQAGKDDAAGPLGPLAPHGSLDPLSPLGPPSPLEADQGIPAPARPFASGPVPPAPPAASPEVPAATAPAASLENDPLADSRAATGAGTSSGTSFAAGSGAGMAKAAARRPDAAPGSGHAAGAVGQVSRQAAGESAGDAAGQVPAQAPDQDPGQTLDQTFDQAPGQTLDQGLDQKLEQVPLQEASQPAGTQAGAGGERSAEAGGLAREAMEQTLAERRGGPVRIVAPQNAQDNKLVDIAAANAREEARLKERGGPDDSGDLGGVLARIGQALGLAEPPSRIECVDVSHTGGSATRVGLVVWVDGLHQPEASRVYALEGTGGDDYKALYAWAGRRLESGPPWPDLLLVDGGRGQIAAVARGLADHARQAGHAGQAEKAEKADRANLVERAGQGQASSFPLAGIAKARDEQGHADRRAGNVADRIFLPGRSDAVAALREGSPELLFLQNVRDSAHRFAISRHRRARGKAALQGELTRLPGIGPATARLLWDAFGSIEAMRRASLADLEALPGIGPAKAKGLHERLHGREPEATTREARRTSPRQASGQESGQASGQAKGQGAGHGAGQPAGRKRRRAEDAQKTREAASAAGRTADKPSAEPAAEPERAMPHAKSGTESGAKPDAGSTVRADASADARPGPCADAGAVVAQAAGGQDQAAGKDQPAVPSAVRSGTRSGGQSASRSAGKRSAT